jgi:4-amino-4-deoxy-L-arabinose transferase-like glycosyltransferase
MDDLREAEVAREMDEDGNFVIPHLAGLPFVEKPSGFPTLVVLAYRLAGEPSPEAGRLVSSAFAAAMLMGTYLLGRRAQGSRVGLIAASLVGLSPMFCRVSHEILLDNALGASVVLAQLFLWESVNDESLRERRRASWALGLCTGLSFLFKGFVGPGLVASGVLLHAAARRSWTEVRPCSLGRVAVGALVPALTWLVPFVVTADRDLLRSFFIDNHLLRFTHAFNGHARPFYFYLQTLGYKLGWGALLLVPALAGAGRGRADRFVFSMGLGPLLLLSMARGKEALYLLPAYPALALVGTLWLERKVSERGPVATISSVVLLAGAGLAVLVAGVLATIHGAWALPAILGALAVGVLHRDSDQSPEWKRLLAAQILWGMTCLLFVCGPEADREDARQEWRPVAGRLLAEAGDAEIILYWPTDELRGALAFPRRRTAREARTPEEVLDLLHRHPEAIAVDYGAEEGGLPALARAEALRGRGVVESMRLPYRGKLLSVWKIVPDPD